MIENIIKAMDEVQPTWGKSTNRELKESVQKMKIWLQKQTIRHTYMYVWVKWHNWQKWRPNEYVWDKVKAMSQNTGNTKRQKILKDR